MSYARGKGFSSPGTGRVKCYHGRLYQVSWKMPLESYWSFSALSVTIHTLTRSLSNRSANLPDLHKEWVFKDAHYTSK